MHTINFLITRSVFKLQVHFQITTKENLHTLKNLPKGKGQKKLDGNETNYGDSVFNIIFVTT